MDRIVKTCTVSNSREMAFQKFIHDIHAWWPRKYTWSQNKLEEIRIEPKAGGLCTEIGPLGFRCDWGRVTTLVPDHEIELKWQIGPHREPVPNPENVEMQFELNCTYKSNIEMFPVFQEYYRLHQPPALIIWGRYDAFYDLAEVNCYKRDLPQAQIHVLDGGHMVLETNFNDALSLIQNFMSSK